MTGVILLVIGSIAVGVFIFAPEVLMGIFSVFDEDEHDDYGIDDG